MQSFCEDWVSEAWGESTQVVWELKGQTGSLCWWAVSNQVLPLSPRNISILEAAPAQTSLLLFPYTEIPSRSHRALSPGTLSSLRASLMAELSPWRSSSSGPLSDGAKSQAQAQLSSSRPLLSLRGTSSLLQQQREELCSSDVELILWNILQSDSSCSCIK